MERVPAGRVSRSVIDGIYTAVARTGRDIRDVAA